MTRRSFLAAVAALVAAPAAALKPSRYDYVQVYGYSRAPRMTYDEATAVTVRNYTRVVRATMEEQSRFLAYMQKTNTEYLSGGTIPITASHA